MMTTSFTVFRFRNTRDAVRPRMGVANTTLSVDTDHIDPLVAVTSVKLVEIREWSWGATTGGVASGKGGLRQGRDRRHGGLCCGRSAAIKPCAFGAPLRGCGA